MMNFRTPKFWQKKYSFFTLILIPFSIIWIIISLIRRLTSSEKNYSIPIICVGNIYVGGTGKTPLVREIYNILNSIGKNPAIIKKMIPKVRTPTFIKIMVVVSIRDSLLNSLNYLFQNLFYLS